MTLQDPLDLIAKLILAFEGKGCPPTQAENLAKLVVAAQLVLQDAATHQEKCALPAEFFKHLDGMLDILMKKV